ncbi:MAG: YccF domain-containing protein [Alphaproteobacteria bacterium]|nr:YccF domain-containing protein [Alphaproteobacteria bacterium]MBF0391376.1 YccF domain-containing protein [Alphaproteobacteria bacterium]
MSLILNIVWMVFGGLVMAFGWLIASLVMALTIIGLPWTPAAMRIAGYTLLPFGRHVVDRDAGALSFLGNVIWFLLAGWWLALGHLMLALFYAITIIGLPFAWAHLKLAGLSLAPVGKAVVSADEE